MISQDRNKLTRIGVFYDGNFFLHVSNYYLHHHERNSRINISGLHDFIINRVSREEGIDRRYCQIVDSHYFRGRLSAKEADEKDLLLKERSFDDVLMNLGITTHYLPLESGGEKGIDVWLALETYELAIHKRFDVCVIVASDGDFVPLVRKLNTIGARVMLMYWEFSYVAENNKPMTTRTSQRLINEATYPIQMNSVIDDKSNKNNYEIDNIFMGKRNFERHASETQLTENKKKEILEGEIFTLNSNQNGRFGFISTEIGDNLFFSESSCLGDYDDLEKGDKVSFTIGENKKGKCAFNVIKYI